MLVGPAYPQDQWPEGVPYPNLIAWREHQNANNVQLRAEKMRLQAEIARPSSAEKTRLRAENAQLRADTAELQAENARLKESVAAHIATTERLNTRPVAEQTGPVRNTAQHGNESAIDRASSEARSTDGGGG